MFIRPGVQVKPVEGNPLVADRDLGEIGPHLRVEAVTVHAEILGGIADTNEPGQDLRTRRRNGWVSHARLPPGPAEKRDVRADGVKRGKKKTIKGI